MENSGSDRDIELEPVAQNRENSRGDHHPDSKHVGPQTGLRQDFLTTRS